MFTQGPWQTCTGVKLSMMLKSFKGYKKNFVALLKKETTVAGNPRSWETNQMLSLFGYRWDMEKTKRRIYTLIVIPAH